MLTWVALREAAAAHAADTGARRFGVGCGSPGPKRGAQMVGRWLCIAIILVAEGFYGVGLCAGM